MNNLDFADTSATYFDVCAKIEGLCAELYHYYSDLFVDNAEISRLWKKTALEEENHQKQFVLAYKLREDVEFDLEADLERTYRIHQKLDSLLLYVRQNPPDAITALTRAIEMEESLAHIHLDSSVKFKNADISRMFQALREFDLDHVKSLRHCLAIMTLHQSEMNG